MKKANKKIKLTKKAVLALADELNAQTRETRDGTQPPAGKGLYHFTSANWKQEVLEAKVPVLVDFTATWCGPCKQFAPVIERIAKAHPEVKVGKLDLDESESVVEKYRIQSVPTLVVFINGKAVGTSVGTCPQAEVEKFLTQAIKKASGA